MQIAVLIFSFFLFSYSIGDKSSLSMEFEYKILENKKYVVTKGEIFYKKEGGILTTRFTKPFENITIVNNKGEVKNYDVKDNTLMLSNSDFSVSNLSYLVFFINGNLNDLGLAKSGYSVKSSKVEDGMLVSNWILKSGFNSPVANITLVHEKKIPVYIEFSDNKKKILGKVYFNSFAEINKIQMPTSITEILYGDKKDSTITQKKYFNFKTNNQVNPNYLNYIIPRNAKYVKL